MSRNPRYKEAADLLRQHLTTFPDRPPTVWENQEQDPTKWPNVSLIMLAQVVFNKPWLRTYDWGHVISGFMQLTILARENTHTAAGEKIADRLCEHFPSGLQLGKVRIYELPSVGPAYNNPPYWRLPILIPWKYLT